MGRDVPSFRLIMGFRWCVVCLELLFGPVEESDRVVLVECSNCICTGSLINFVYTKDMQFNYVIELVHTHLHTYTLIISRGIC